MFWAGKELLDKEPENSERDEVPRPVNRKPRGNPLIFLNPASQAPSAQLHRVRSRLCARLCNSRQVLVGSWPGAHNPETRTENIRHGGCKSCTAGFKLATSELPVCLGFMLFQACKLEPQVPLKAPQAHLELWQTLIMTSSLKPNPLNPMLVLVTITHGGCCRRQRLQISQEGKREGHQVDLRGICQLNLSLMMPKLGSSDDLPGRWFCRTLAYI